MNADLARTLLSAERLKAERRLQALRREDLSIDADASDYASTSVEEEIDDALEASLADQLAAIERAEDRLARGVFGLSVESGRPITDARLRVVPWAERTAEEQERFERGLDRQAAID